MESRVGSPYLSILLSVPAINSFPYLVQTFLRMDVVEPTVDGYKLEKIEEFLGQIITQLTNQMNKNIHQTFSNKWLLLK